MCNIQISHKTAVLENSEYLRELHASHHCNEQKQLVQQNIVELMAAKQISAQEQFWHRNPD